MINPGYIGLLAVRLTALEEKTELWNPILVFRYFEQ
jgi:hypothetical protein